MDTKVQALVDSLLDEVSATYTSVGHIGSHLTDLYMHDGEYLDVKEDEGNMAHGYFWDVNLGIASGRVDKQDNEGSIAFNVYKKGVEFFVLGTMGKRRVTKRMIDKVISDLIERYPNVTWYVVAPGSSMVSISKFYSDNF